MSTALSINTNQSIPTLESVKVDFLNWRNQENRSKIIPDKLWHKVFLLLTSHKQAPTLRALGISTTQLENKARLREQSLLANTASPSSNTVKNETRSFVKAIVTTPIQSTHCFDVILTKVNGTTLQIQRLPHDDAMTLIQSFAG